MCGIVGFIGHRQASPVLVEGLEKLSYRGYDSAGIAVMGRQGMQSRKKQGKVARLKELLEQQPAEGTAGIGHTRWATHGKPSDLNAHPHTDASGKIAIVHNGMIENEYQLRKALEKNGEIFRSETDTEVVSRLLGRLYDGDMLHAIVEVKKRLEGSYALAILNADEPDRIFFTRCGSPLIAACADGEGMLASDVSALLGFSRDVVYLKEHHIGVLTRLGMEMYDETGNAVPYEVSHVDWEQSSAEKGGYAHFMLKEIHEQPLALQNAAAGRGDRPGERRWLPMSDQEIRNVEKITLIGCGTAYYASVLGSSAFEQMARIPSHAEIASEYRYRNAVVGPKELFIAVSQSGETADTLAAVRMAIRKGARVIGICNVAASSLVREVGEENTLYTCAGPEISVASTKAYVTQVELLLLMAAAMGKARQTLPDERRMQLYESLRCLSEKARKTLELEPIIRKCARYAQNQSCVLFVGRGADYALSLEAALKLKEISYLFSQAYPAGEMKHGPIALLKEGQLVVAIATQKKVIEKTLANLQEIRARGACILAVCTQELAEKVGLAADELVVIPDTDEWLAPILAAITMQLFAYHVALERGCDVDQPRNLAKSVTVE